MHCHITSSSLSVSVPPSVPPFGYLRCFKSDLFARKSKVDLLNQQNETSFCVHSPSQCQSTTSVSIFPSQCLTPFVLPSQGYQVKFICCKNLIRRFRLPSLGVYPHLVSVPRFGDLKCFGSDQDAVKSKLDLYVDA